jgi:rhodanese-related sulfurtransferase
MSSHHAAGRAAEAGYTDVKVLSPGLKGWKEAGKPTVSVPLRGS